MSKSKFYIGEPVLVRLEYEEEEPLEIFKGVFQGMKESGLCQVDVPGKEGGVGFTILTAEENISESWEDENQYDCSCCDWWDESL